MSFLDEAGGNNEFALRGLTGNAVVNTDFSDPSVFNPLAASFADIARYGFARFIDARVGPPLPNTPSARITTPSVSGPTTTSSQTGLQAHLPLLLIGAALVALLLFKR